MSDSNTLGVAIIGLGTVGRRFVEHFQVHDGFRLVGGFDVAAASAAAARTDFGVQVFDDAGSLITDRRVDVVYIAVPPLYHELYVDQTLAAQKTIFCEKPLGVDNDDTAAMVERVERSGARAAVNFVFGAAPSATAMIAQVTDGSCGEIHSADLRLHFCRWPRDWQAAAEWLRDRDQGGWVREVVSHYVFLMHRMFGPAVIENATVDFPDDGSSEQGLVAALTCGTTRVRVLGTSDAAGPDEVEFTVRGRDRSLRLSNWYQLTAATGDQPWSPALPPGEMAPAAAYGAQLDQVTKLAQGMDHSLATFGEARAVQQVIEGLLDTGAA